MRAPVIALLAVLATLSGLALAARPASQAPTLVRVEQRSGAFGQENSHAGRPILSVERLLPGQSRSGTVTVRNTGENAQAFTLMQSPPRDTPGTGGLELSQHLRLEVADAITGARMYEGTLAGLSSAPAGELAAGEARTYSFTASLLRDGPGSGLSGATSAVDYEGRAEDAATGGAGGSEPDPEAGSEPEPVAPTTAPPGGAPAPGTRVPGTGVPSRADRRAPRLTLALTGAGEIRRHRRLRLRLRCDEACRVTVRARLAITRSRRTFRFRTRIARLPANRRAMVTLRPSRATTRRVRIALSRRRLVTVRVVLSARDRAGNARRVSYRLRVRR